MIYLQYLQVGHVQEGGCINIKTIRVDQWVNPWPWKSVYDSWDQGLVSKVFWKRIWSMDFCLNTKLGRKIRFC